MFKISFCDRRSHHVVVKNTYLGVIPYSDLVSNISQPCDLEQATDSLHACFLTIICKIKVIIFSSWYYLEIKTKIIHGKCLTLCLQCDNYSINGKWFFLFSLLSVTSQIVLQVLFADDFLYPFTSPVRNLEALPHFHLTERAKLGPLEYRELESRDTTVFIIIHI